MWWNPDQDEDRRLVYWCRLPAADDVAARSRQKMHRAIRKLQNMNVFNPPSGALIGCHRALDTRLRCSFSNRGGIVAEATTEIYFREPLHFRDELRKRWDDRHVMVTSRTELEAFYENLRRDPRTKELAADPRVVEEALDFYNRVVADGRAIYDLRTDPKSVADRLGLEVDDRAAELISKAAWMTGEAESNDITIVLAIVIVVVVAVPERVVIDWSQQVEVKF